MTNQASSTAQTGTPFLALLGLLFIALKLTGYIDWSWWWVTLPLWGGLALLLAIATVIGAGIGIALLVANLRDRWAS